MARNTFLSEFNLGHFRVTQGAEVDRRKRLNPDPFFDVRN